MSFSCKLSDEALDNGTLVILGALDINPPILKIDTSRPRKLGLVCCHMGGRGLTPRSQFPNIQTLAASSVQGRVWPATSKSVWSPVLVGGQGGSRSVSQPRGGVEQS